MKCQPKLNFENSRSKWGFSLTEVVISLAIIAGSLTTFVTLSIGSLHQLRQASDYYSASLIARNQIERLRTMDFDAAADADEPAHAVDEFGNTTSSGDFTRQTEITQLNPDLLEINVTVYFPSPRGSLSGQPYLMATVFCRDLYQ